MSAILSGGLLQAQPEQKSVVAKRGIKTIIIARRNDEAIAEQLLTGAS